MRGHIHPVREPSRFVVGIVTRQGSQSGAPFCLDAYMPYEGLGHEIFRGDAGVVGSAQLADLGESGAVSQQVVGSNPAPPEKVLPKGRA